MARRSEQVGYKISVFADAAESFGASLSSDAGLRPAGSLGVAAILSFNGNKVMTTSGGGMFLTDSKEVADQVRYLATQARQPVIHYEHTDIGYNYRMSNVLAALGRAQLSRLDEMIAKRKQIREEYQELFENIPGVTVFQTYSDQVEPADQHDNYWLTSIVVDPAVAGWSSIDLGKALTDKNIESRPLWKPMHLQPVFDGAPAMVNGNSETLFRTGITLPSGSGLTDDERTIIMQITRAFLDSVGVAAA